MKKLEYYPPIKNYIDNYLTQELSKYEGNDLHVMSDLLRNQIGKVYGFILANIAFKKGQITEDILKKSLGYGCTGKRIKRNIKNLGGNKK